MQLDYTDRHVVVTGGTGALGAAVVEQLVELGAMVHIPAHRAPDPAKFSLGRHERVKIVSSVDLVDEANVAKFYSELSSLWASIHTAGGFAAGLIANTTLADFRAMMETNGVTCFLCCREAVRKIRSGANQAGGRIVNVAAKPAVIPTAGLCAYAASKAVVANLTLSLSEELARDRIWVNAVIPSIMDTPANRAAMPKADFTRWPSVSDVAATICFLASPQNTSTRGALVPVYGQS